MARLLFATALVISLLGARTLAQDRPDFSGTWVPVSQSSTTATDHSFVVTQDVASITIETPVMSYGSGRLPVTETAHKETFVFNGGETKTTRPRPDWVSDANPRRILWAYTASTLSRAAWHGDLLIMVSHIIQRVGIPKRSSEFDSEQTVQTTFEMVGDQLAVTRLSIADPDMDIKMRIEPGGVSKTTYRKASIGQRAEGKKPRSFPIY